MAKMKCVECSLVKTLQTQSCPTEPLCHTTDSPSGQYRLTYKYEHGTPFKISARHDYVPPGTLPDFCLCEIKNK